MTYRDYEIRAVTQTHIAWHIDEDGNISDMADDAMWDVGSADIIHYEVWKDGENLFVVRPDDVARKSISLEDVYRFIDEEIDGIDEDWEYERQANN